MDRLDLRKSLGQSMEKKGRLERKCKCVCIHLCLGSGALEWISQTEVWTAVTLTHLSSPVDSTQPILNTQYSTNSYIRILGLLYRLE